VRFVFKKGKFMRFLVYGFMMLFFLNGEMDFVVAPVEPMAGFPTYHFIVKDAQEDIFDLKMTSFSVYHIFEKVKLQDGVLKNSEGAELTQILGGFSCGEGILYTLKGAEKEWHTVVIPYPIKAKNGDNQLIEALLLDATGCHFWVAFKGFKPNVELRVQTSLSSKQTETAMVKINKDGEGHMDLTVGDFKAKEGVFRVVAYSTEGKPVVLNHLWGKAAFYPPKEIYQILGRKG